MEDGYSNSFSERLLEFKELAFKNGLCVPVRVLKPLEVLITFEAKTSETLRGWDRVGQ